MTTLVAITLAEHDATSYAFYHPKFQNTHYDGHDHYVSILKCVLTVYVKVLIFYLLCNFLLLGENFKIIYFHDYLWNYIMYEFKIYNEIGIKIKIYDKNINWYKLCSLWTFMLSA